MIALTDWIRNSPCPIIGIGDGKLKAECDLAINNMKELPSDIKEYYGAPRDINGIDSAFTSNRKTTYGKSL